MIAHADAPPSQSPNAGGPVRLPPHAPGMRIGLFGGSFNPPHAGHRLVSVTAMRRLGLDRVWWLVTPGNPLKDRSRLAPLASRMAAARRIADHPRIVLTDVEVAIGTRYTYDTLSYLVRRCPGVRFVWIMGADNLADFHRWQRWRAIARLMPVAVVDRPGATCRAVGSRAGQFLAPYRIDESDARLLPGLAPPALVFLHGPRSSLSSTFLRSKHLPTASAELKAPQFAPTLHSIDG